MSSTNLIEDVAQFHQEVLNMPKPTCQMLSAQDMSGRVGFLFEEVDELDLSYSMGDITGVADALADIVYVALGTAYMMGLPFEEIWAAVQKANMAKEPGQTKRNMRIDAIKPAGWVGPENEIAKLIKEIQQ